MHRELNLNPRLLYPVPWFSVRVNFTPQEIFDNNGRHILVVATGRQELLASGAKKTEMWLNIPLYTGQPSITQNYLAQNVNSAEVEKP